MALVRATVEAYTALLWRAFNGAIEVDGTRIVAHPSGTLIARTPRGSSSAITPAPAHPLDKDNDWSDL